MNFTGRKRYRVGWFKKCILQVEIEYLYPYPEIFWIDARPEWLTVEEKLK